MTLKRRKQRLLSREEISINREADYIIEKALIRDSRVVGIGKLVFFSTKTGDAWILEAADICSNLPVPIQIYIIDYDTEGADLDELMTTPESDEFVGHLGEARCDEAYVNSIFNSLPVKK